MTIRAYSGLLILEDIFDHVPNEFQDVANLANSVFSPTVQVVDDDCRTTLGRNEPVNFELEGRVELASGEVISEERIVQLLEQGRYNVDTRHTSHCTSRGGVCKKCYMAANPKAVEPMVGDLVQIPAEYSIYIQVFRSVKQEYMIPLTVNAQFYSDAYVYIDGRLLGSDEYSISANTLYLNEPRQTPGNVVIHFRGRDRRPFLYWLAKTYSGSLLGLRSLPAAPLPLRSMMLSGHLSENKLESVIEYTTSSKVIPSDLLAYLPTIRDPLEKAMFALALNTVFAGVTA